jgi:ribA/ribD-fused uncharacterized protein
MSKDKYHFFWGGEFSQWYPSTFEIDGKTYNCAEQYMMYQKALHFGDISTAKRIMKEPRPKEQKALGRSITPFDADSWMNVCFEIVKRGNVAKFTQNPKLLKVLLSTGDKELVEASPYDKIWGIGLSETDPKIYDKSNWDGLNLLGKVCMEVREELKKDVTLYLKHEDDLNDIEYLKIK